MLKNRCVSIVAALTLLVSLCVAVDAAEKAKPGLRAGAATGNITPWLGEPIVGGWNSPPAKHVHDDLHVRCLVLDDGATRIAMAIVDSVGVSREVFDDAKRQIQEATGLPPQRMLMSATHTHSATSARSANAVRPNDDLDSYQRFLARRIADTMRVAMNNLEPAQVGWGQASEPRHVFNRRWRMKTLVPNPFGGQDQVQFNPGHANANKLEPAGPVDPEIVFFAVRSKECRPIALLANYSLHYVGGVGGNHISADYFAAFADRIQQLIGADRLDPPFVGIMTNGTSGNINNINFAAKPESRKPYEQIRRVAGDVADKVFEQYKALEWRDDVPLGIAQRELELAVRKPTPEQVAKAKEMLADPNRPDKLPHERTYAQRIMHQHEAPPTVQVPLQAVRIGELGIATVPFETFVETGLEIKAKSPMKPTFTISLANGSYGYLPTPEQHQLGGYETWLGSNKVEIEASTKIAQSLLEMLSELKQSK